jgi:NAD(P)-dependent dehydrogenase (short-subunit alcohol dehydrogenase family)
MFKDHLRAMEVGQKGKTVIVTGGLGILGSEIAKKFAHLGCTILVTDLASQISTELEAELKKFPDSSIIYQQLDVSSEKSVQKLLTYCEDSKLNIDVVVNNAASKSKDLNKFFDPFDSYSLETWNEVMDVNVGGVFLMCKHFGSHMIKHKAKGCFVQISSIYGIMAPDQRIYEGSFYEGREINTPCVYSASKASVIGISKYLSTYWAEFGIRVNTVTPGGIASGQNSVFQEKYSSRIPLRRMAQVHEIAAGVVFLADDSSSYITGHNLVIDGGLAAW